MRGLQQPGLRRCGPHMLSLAADQIHSADCCAWRGVPPTDSWAQQTPCPVLQVGPCWVPQRRLKPSEIDEIVTRLNVVKKIAKAAEEPPPPPAVGPTGFCVQCCLLGPALQQSVAGNHPEVAGCAVAQLQRPALLPRDHLAAVMRAAGCALAHLLPPALLQVRLSYKHDASKGSGFKAFQEVLVPVKKVSSRILQPHHQLLATSNLSHSSHCAMACLC